LKKETQTIDKESLRYYNVSIRHKKGVQKWLKKKRSP